MMRFLAVAGNSCLAIRSLIVFLTMFWLIKMRSLSTLAYNLTFYTPMRCENGDEVTFTES